MATRRKRWYLLYKIENECRIHVYEPLQFSELNKRLQSGWRVVWVNQEEGMMDAIIS